jgi:murein DD-endopeptidase MepM/ murein hydrolase activator NlpD
MRATEGIRRPRGGRSPARRTSLTAALVAAVLVSLVGSGLPASATDPTGSASPSASETSTTSEKLTKAQQRRKDAADARARAAAKAAAEAAAKKEAEEAAKLAAEEAHDAAELVKASHELQKAKADLVIAQDALDTARDELKEARGVDAQAQTDLDAAVLAEERATRELAIVEARILSRQDDLGLLARTAYKSNGSMGEWALVLSSTSPNQLAERLAFLQSIGSAGNAVIADLAADRAELLNAQDRLSAARREAETRRVFAAAALAAVSAKEMLAEAAQQQVDAVVEAREAAFQAAKKAAIEDKRQYQVLVVQSGALATRIIELSEELRKGENPPQGTGRFVRPGTGTVTSEYGPRFHPILHYVKVHTGTDFSAGDGIAYAADDGVVLFTEFNVAYGNMTVIDHGKIGGMRIATMYAHQSAVGVKPGDRVVKGQAIGVIGSTGYSTGPHLHFEVRVDGEPLDPGPFLEGAKLPTKLDIADLSTDSDPIQQRLGSAL